MGLFADQPVDQVNRIVKDCRLDMAQLCGDEDPQYWADIEAPVIQQIKVRDLGDREDTTDQTVRHVEKVVNAGHYVQQVYGCSWSAESNL